MLVSNSNISLKFQRFGYVTSSVTWQLDQQSNGDL